MEEIRNKIKTRFLEKVLESKHTTLPFDKELFEGKFCIIKDKDITIEGKIKEIIGDNKVTYDHAFPIGPFYNIKGDNFEIKAIERGRYECSEGNHRGKKAKFYSFIEEPMENIKISFIEYI